MQHPAIISNNRACQVSQGLIASGSSVAIFTDLLAPVMRTLICPQGTGTKRSHLLSFLFQRQHFQTSAACPIEGNTFNTLFPCTVLPRAD